MKIKLLCSVIGGIVGFVLARAVVYTYWHQGAVAGITGIIAFCVFVVLLIIVTDGNLDA